MRFVFDYEETLVRRISIEASHFSDAIKEIERRIDAEEIILGAEDFAGAELRMPLGENFLPRLQKSGECVETGDDVDILVDFW